MTQYDVLLVIIVLVEFVILILNFAKSSSKETVELRNSNIRLTAAIENLNKTLEDVVVKNKEDHDHFYRKINEHETRITVLEDHDEG